MVDTFEALGVAIVAMLPGALYIWGFERQAGQWGLSAADRLLRFVGWSAILHLALAPLSYAVWNTYVRTGRLGAAKDISWWLWPVVALYVAIPIVAGTGTGRLARSPDRNRFANLLVGPNPAPTAWESLFAESRNGWIRLKLKTGPWVGGLYARLAKGETGISSYAAGLPHELDLYIARAVEIDQDNGQFLVDDDGAPRWLDTGILVRWNEVEYLQFEEVEEKTS